jgi:hypothetical protein
MIRPPGFQNLFFIKRRPKLRVKPLVIADRTENRTLWLQHIQGFTKQDFVTQSILTQYNMTLSPAIQMDVDALNERLVEDYIRADYKANLQQNRYYAFQWTIALLGFLATATAAYAAANGGDGPASQEIVQRYTLAATALSLLLTFVISMNGFLHPQRDWFQMRRIAEQLRKYYFLYLTHQPPFDRETRHLPSLVAKICNPSSSNTSKDISADVINTSKPLDPFGSDDAKTLLDLYINLRLNTQIGWYELRRDEYRLNMGATFALSVFIPLSISFFSSLNLTSPSTLLSFLIVMLPGLTALLLAAQRVYDWERQVKLYEETAHKLRRAKAEAEDDQSADILSTLNQLVAKTDVIFSSEADQWGQPLADDVVLTSDQLFDAAIQRAGLTDTQRKEIRAKVAEFTGKPSTTT